MACQGTRLSPPTAVCLDPEPYWKRALLTHCLCQVAQPPTNVSPPPPAPSGCCLLLILFLWHHREPQSLFFPPNFKEPKVFIMVIPMTGYLEIGNEAKGIHL